MWFGYDPLGRCVKRWVGPGDGSAPGGATYFYYDGWNLVQEGLSANSVARTYVHGARVDEIVASAAGGGPWLYHQYDARGHCIMLTNESGGIVEQYEYDAFGQPYIYDANSNLVARNLGSPVGNRFLFTGREWLKELRVYDYRARLYQPELGRFVQPDPKQFEAGDYNLYRYCHNDPVNKSDPMGLFESPGWMQALIPDQSEWDAAVTQFQAGNYGMAAALTGAMVGQQLMAVYILGASTRVNAPLQAARTALSTEVAAVAKSPVMQKVEKQLAEHGEKSLLRSLASFEKKIAIHTQKIADAKAAGGYTSSMQREMRAFEQERDAIKQVLANKK